MLFGYVVEEEVLECNESEHMDSNMCKTLSTCTFFEESVPGPSSTINSDTFVQSINQLIPPSQILRPPGGGVFAPLLP